MQENQSFLTIPLSDDIRRGKLREIGVITAVRKLSEYIFVALHKAPVAYRWSLVSSMQNTALDLVNLVYLANAQQGEDRINTQYKIRAQFNTLNFLSDLCKQNKVLSKKQFNHIMFLLADCEKMYWGWKRSVNN